MATDHPERETKGDSQTGHKAHKPKFNYPAIAYIVVLVAAGWVVAFEWNEWTAPPKVIVPSAVIGKCITVTALGFFVAWLVPFIRFPGFKRAPRARGADRLIKHTEDEAKKAKKEENEAKEEESKAEGAEKKAKEDKTKAKDHATKANQELIRLTQAATHAADLHRNAVQAQLRARPAEGPVSIAEGIVFEPRAPGGQAEASAQAAVPAQAIDAKKLEELEQLAEDTAQRRQVAQVAAKNAAKEAEEKAVQASKASKDAKQAADKAKKAADKTEQAAKDEEDAREFEKIWPKLSQPEYAIGLGILSKADYDSLVTTYQTKSTLVAGLTLPMLLLTSILLIRIGGFYQGYAEDPCILDWWYGVLGALETALFIAAADLKHKFEMSMQAAIAAAYAKMIEVKESQNGSPAPTVPDQIASALKQAKIVGMTNLHILPPDKVSAPPKQPGEGGS